MKQLLRTFAAAFMFAGILAGCLAVLLLVISDGALSTIADCRGVGVLDLPEAKRRIVTMN